jgi:hypothetical protein
MKGMVFGAAVLLAAARPPAGDWAHAPKPSDYPAPAAFKGKPAAVELSSPRARQFRTVLGRGAKEGPNFAGHYTMVVWGCGLDSFSLAVVDARTGHVFFPPFSCTTLAGGFGLPKEVAPENANPAFRVDSRLFVVVGVEDSPTAEPEGRSVQFWVFDKGRFTLVYWIPAPWRIEDGP